MKFHIELHGKHYYKHVDYVIVNLTQLERVKTELKRRRYDENSVDGNFVNNPNCIRFLKHENVF